MSAKHPPPHCDRCVRLYDRTKEIRVYYCRALGDATRTTLGEGADRYFVMTSRCRCTDCYRFVRAASRLGLVYKRRADRRLSA